VTRTQSASLFFRRPSFVVATPRKNLILGQETLIMGILNLTPDSFSADGLLSSRGQTAARSLAKATQLIQEGAHIIDIGGESSRPGAKPISPDEEIQRIIPTFKKLRKKTSCILSVDTYKPLVARHALDAGADMINDIMGTTLDKELFKMAARYQAAIVLMHMRGNPQNMQKKTHYHNMMKEITASLRKATQNCLEMGIKSDRIIIDPGIGFAKTPGQNIEIIRRLRELNVLKKPILIGTSRKSFIGKILQKDITQRLPGTLASVSAAVFAGAHIVRVHDVKETLDTVTMIDKIFYQ